MTIPFRMSVVSVSDSTVFGPRPGPIGDSIIGEEDYKWSVSAPVEADEYWLTMSTGVVGGAGSAWVSFSMVQFQIYRSQMQWMRARAVLNKGDTDEESHELAIRPQAINQVYDPNPFGAASSPRMTHTLEGVPIRDLGVDITYELDLWIEPTRYQLTSGVVTGEADAIRCLTQKWPDSNAEIAWQGNGWNPGARVTEPQTLTNQFGVPRVGRAQITRDSDNAEIVNGLFTYADYDTMTFQHDGRLRPEDHTVKVTAIYDDFASLERTEEFAERAVTFVPVTNDATFTAALSGTDPYAVVLDYDKALNAVERTTPDGWENVTQDDDAIVGLVDYPPLNTATKYRGWHCFDINPTDGVYGTDTITDYLETAELSISAKHWILTAVDTGEYLELPASAVGVERLSTTQTRPAPVKGSTTIRGTITDPVFTLAVSLTSPSMSAQLYRMFTETKLLLRGPHGQREQVAVTGTISEETQGAHSLFTDTVGTTGADASTSFLTVASFTMTVDNTEW